MTRDLRLYLQDILESISAIEEYTRKLSEKEFLSKQQVQDAVLRRFEIIGEAVKKVDENFKREHSDVPWKEIAGMRDILIHEYFGVNLKRVWLVIKNDLPVFKKKLQKDLKDRKLTKEPMNSSTNKNSFSSSQRQKLVRRPLKSGKAGFIRLALPTRGPYAAGLGRRDTRLEGQNN